MDSWVEQYQQEAAARLDQAQGIKADLARVTGTASSARGEVSVTVGPGGNLVDIEFNDKVSHVAPAELAKLVLRTAQQAHHNAGQAMLDVMRPMVGEGAAMDYLKSQLPPEPPKEEPNSFRPRQTRDDRGSQDPNEDEGFQGFRR